MFFPTIYLCEAKLFTKFNQKNKFSHRRLNAQVQLNIKEVYKTVNHCHSSHFGDSYFLLKLFMLPCNGFLLLFFKLSYQNVSINSYYDKYQ